MQLQFFQRNAFDRRSGSRDCGISVELPLSAGVVVVVGVVVSGTSVGARLNGATVSVVRVNYVPLHSDAMLSPVQLDP